MSGWSRRSFLASATALLQVPEKGVVVIVLGPPGAGKTTQATFLKKKYQIPIFSAETLLKKSHDRKSDLSKKMKSKLAPEELLTDDGMNELVRNAVVKADTKRGFILDGYPQTNGQAKYLGDLLKEVGLSEPLIVHLDVSDSVVQQRLTARNRADDKPAIIERRLAQYRNSEKAVINYYGEPRIMHIDGTKSELDISRSIDAELSRRGK